MTVSFAFKKIKLSFGSLSSDFGFIFVRMYITA